MRRLRKRQLKRWKEVLELCARAGDSLGPLDARLIGQLRLALRLESFAGDALELEFAERNGKLVVASEVRVKVDGAAEAIVASADPRAMRQFVFILGAAESLGGKLTEAGLLYRFLGITP